MKTYQRMLNPIFFRIFVSFCILFICSSAIIAGQGKVTGTITDAETQMPIEAATVELLNAQDTSLIAGVITNQDGVYTFDGVEWGGYMLRASYLGYNKKFVDAFGVTPEKPEVKFSKTALVSDATKIDEVSVYARMMTGTIEDDKIIYIVNPQAAEFAQSGLELLRQVPDCQVNFMDNSVTLEGSTNILFLVNGKRVEKDYLLQLNPKIIDKYEIMTNPGVRYDASYDAVINVVLKRDMNYGVSTYAHIAIPTSRTFFTNNNIGVDYFRKGVRVFANAWGGGSNWDVHFDTDRLTDTTTLIQRFYSENNGNMYMGFNYGFDWFADDNTTINFYSTVNPRLNNENDYHTDSYLIQNGDSTYTYTNTTELGKNYFNDYSLYYQRKFAKEGHDISAEVYFSTNNKFKNKDDVFNSDSSTTFSTQVNDDYKNSYRAKIDYNYPLVSKLIFSTGVAGEYK